MAGRPVADQVVVFDVFDAVVVEGVMAGVGRMDGGRVVAFVLEVVGGASYPMARAPAVACHRVTLDEVVVVAAVAAAAASGHCYAQFGRKYGIPRSLDGPEPA